MTFDEQYDMLTTPITTSHFHSRVLTLLSSHLSQLKPVVVDGHGTTATTSNTRSLTIPPLSPADSHLSPNEAMSQVVGVTSSWIDLCSPDPLIADISRQVLMLEVAYAAFCGLGYLLVPGPKLHHGSMHSEGVAYYARVIQDALNTGSYIQFHIWLRPVDSPDLEVDQMGDLAPLARAEFLEGADEEPRSRVDPFGTWEAWDIIRRICKYHARLLVGKNKYFIVILSLLPLHDHLLKPKKKNSSLLVQVSSSYVRSVSVALGARAPSCI